MFKELRLQNQLTQAEVAARTGLSQNYVLKAEQLTFPIPSPVLASFYMKLDPSLDLDYLKSWYAAEQLKTREAWLESWMPLENQPTFRHSWADIYALPSLIPPTEYALSSGLCIPASVVYAMGKGAKPHTMFVVLDQLIDYIKSGRALLMIDGDVTPDEALSGLLNIKERFK